jgi:hypothetical protein
MAKERQSMLCLLCGLVLVAMLGVVGPVTAKTPTCLPDTANQQDETQTQSVSGTIASVGRNSFTLTLASAITKDGKGFQETTPKSMLFLIDKNTTIDGKLKVGASADVTYRQANDNNIAINVRVAY